MISVTDCIEEFVVEENEDIASIRANIRAIANSNFNTLKQTKMVTACVELLRNALLFAGQGRIRIEKTSSPDNEKQGFKFVVSDNGPGIPDPDKAMQDGWSGPSSNGLGKGLPGTKNLSDEFSLETSPGEGTKVTIVFYQ